MKRPPAKDLIAALEEARKHRNVGQSICYCLPVDQAGYYLRYYIARQLDGHTYLEGWMRINRPEVHHSNPGAMKRIRLQWIDWMIASIKETG